MRYISLGSKECGNTTSGQTEKSRQYVVPVNYPGKTGKCLQFIHKQTAICTELLPKDSKQTLCQSRYEHLTSFLARVSLLLACASSVCKKLYYCFWLMSTREDYQTWGQLQIYHIMNWTKEGHCPLLTIFIYYIPKKESDGKFSIT